MRNAICVRFMTIFQQVIAVYVADLSEFMINYFERVIFFLENAGIYLKLDVQM